MTIRDFLREKRSFTEATVTAAMASLAQMIAAGVLGAVKTDLARRFAADRTGKGSYFHLKATAYLLVFFEGGCGSLLIIPRQRCASSSATLKFCSTFAVRSRM